MTRTPLNAACTYGVVKKKQEELETLREAFAAGYGSRNWAAKDSALVCLHDDPEFKKTSWTQLALLFVAS
jgi:hypothetical protein